MEKLSIVVPVYNTYPYLRECLDSIINQTYKNLEIIIVNDASPYEEDEIICKEYAEKDNRIVYIKHTENKFQGGARNTGIKAATGKYITFVDSDDYIYNNTLYEKSINQFTDDIDIIYINTKILENEKLVDTNWIKKQDFDKIIIYDKIKHYNPAVWCKIFKSKDFIDNDLYFLEKLKFEDLDFWYRYLIKVKPVAYICGSVYYVYRQQNLSTMHNIAKYLADYYYIFLNMIRAYEENKTEDNRLLLIEYYGHLRIISNNINFIDNQMYVLLVSNICDLLERMNVSEKEFIEYLGADFYQLLFYNKYVYNMFQITKSKMDEKKLKYIFIKENIFTYKLKREFKRVLKQIKGSLKWRS